MTDLQITGTAIVIGSFLLAFGYCYLVRRRNNDMPTYQQNEWF